MLLVEDGVGDVGAFFGAIAPGLSGETHSDCSTWPPERQMAISASSAAIYF